MSQFKKLLSPILILPGGNEVLYQRCLVVVGDNELIASIKSLDKLGSLGVTAMPCDG